MAVPENATKLGTVGIAYKGVYDELATYKYANAVYYNGSTYIALIDNPAGFPSNDGVNWRYLAQGFMQQAVSALTVIDESGILGEVDAEVNAQEFLSKIAELEQGLEDTKANKADVLDSLEEIVANTEDGRIAGANAVSELNSNLSNLFNVNTNGDPIPINTGGTTSTDIIAIFNKLNSQSFWMGFLGNSSTMSFVIIARQPNSQRGFCIRFFTHVDEVDYIRIQGGAITNTYKLDMTAS